MSGLTPFERGNLIHKLFERFYQTWQQDGLGAITAATLPEALARFTRLTHEVLAGLPEADRALEETRLLGSIVARGIAERVFELEVDEGGEIVDRLLEYDLRGPFPFPVLGGMAQKTIAIRGKADRIDVFDDGALRIIDYKLSRLPDIKTSQQIAVYAHCAAIALEARDGPGRIHREFGGLPRVRRGGRSLGVGFNSRKGPAAEAIQARVAEFAATVQHIEHGEFPAKPTPDLCRWCQTPVCAARSIESRWRTMQPSLFDQVRSGSEAGRTAAARPGGARLRDRSGSPRRARGLGRHRQDARARRSLRAPDRARRRPSSCAGDDVHAQSRRGDARPRAGGAESPRRYERGVCRAVGRARRTRDGAVVSTIDAFCFGLLREFPLEADVDPAFEIADETEMARFENEALDLTWRRARGIIGSDENVRLLLSRVRLPQLRDALIACIDRRHVAQPAVAAFIERHVRFRTSTEAGAAFVSRVRDAFHRSPQLRAILDDGPVGAPEFVWLQADLATLGDFPAAETPNCACSSSNIDWPGIS